MIHGIDTDFLVAVEVRGHAFHTSANQLLDSLLASGHTFSLTPQTLAEFIHVVTDAKRLPVPLAMEQATDRAQFWWNATEVVRMHTSDEAAHAFFDLIHAHKLGRKRLLDTMLAATLKAHGVTHLITNNAADYRVFGHFTIVGYQA